jgi:serine/threonine-protein kinase
MILGRVYLEKGMYDEAIAQSKKGISISGEDPYLIGQLGFIYAKAGRRDEAMLELDKLMELSRSEEVPSFAISMIHAGLGSDEEALDWLEKSCDDHEFAMVLLHVEHWMDDLQSNPRFISILEKVGLEQ